MKDPKGRLEQLLQISKGPVWDGDLISKVATQSLNSSGYIKRVKGWSILDPKGLQVLINLGLISSQPF